MRFLNITLLLFLLLGWLTSSHAEEPKKRTVCLNMIVKNERKIIEKCLDSVKDHIDYWVIVDTGSSDGTQDIIQHFFKEKNIPGELYERPWVDFGHNRHEALLLAKGKADYIFFIDADEVLVLRNGFSFIDLDKDYYYAQVGRQNNLEGPRIVLINDHVEGWGWTGVLHEQLFHPKAEELSFLFTQDVFLEGDAKQGGRSQDPKKYYKDAQVLEKTVQENPTHARSVFYLAQSYLCAGEHALALQWYQKRVEMEGKEEETFWALYAIGLLQEKLQFPPDVFLRSYSKAFHYRPFRAEPLFRMAEHYFRSQRYLLGYLLCQFALSLPEPVEIGFVHKDIYRFGLSFVFANCAAGLGKLEEAKSTYQTLLQNVEQDAPPQFLAAVRENLQAVMAGLEK